MSKYPAPGVFMEEIDNESRRRKRTQSRMMDRDVHKGKIAPFYPQNESIDLASPSADVDGHTGSEGKSTSLSRKEIEKLILKDISLSEESWI